MLHILVVLSSSLVFLSRTSPPRPDRFFSQQRHLPNLDSLSEFAKRIARSSAVGAPSETSAATFQTHERSDPTLGASFMSDDTVWLAHTLSVLSRRIRRRVLPVALCLSRRTSPVPRSFHSLSSLLKRKSFARLSALAVACAH